MNFFKRYPLATLIGYVTSALAVLVALQSTGVLTGAAAHWVEVAAGALTVVLTVYARSQVTPVVNPKDEYGRRLVPAPGEHLVSQQK